MTVKPRRYQIAFPDDYNDDGFSLDYVEEPPVEQLQQWEEEGGCETPDGCFVETDGQCEHGYQSWMKVMGLI